MFISSRISATISRVGSTVLRAQRVVEKFFEGFGRTSCRLAVWSSIVVIGPLANLYLTLSLTLKSPAVPQSVWCKEITMVGLPEDKTIQCVKAFESWNRSDHECDWRTGEHTAHTQGDLSEFAYFVSDIIKSSIKFRLTDDLIHTCYTTIILVHLKTHSAAWVLVWSIHQMWVVECRPEFRPAPVVLYCYVCLLK